MVLEISQGRIVSTNLSHTDSVRLRLLVTIGFEQHPGQIVTARPTAARPIATYFRCGLNQTGAKVRLQLGGLRAQAVGEGKAHAHRQGKEKPMHISRGCKEDIYIQDPTKKIDMAFPLWLWGEAEKGREPNRRQERIVKF